MGVLYRRLSPTGLLRQSSSSINTGADRRGLLNRLFPFALLHSCGRTALRSGVTGAEDGGEDRCDKDLRDTSPFLHVFSQGLTVFKSGETAGDDGGELPGELTTFLAAFTFTVANPPLKLA
jgi:hypothetical protein